MTPIIDFFETKRWLRRHNTPSNRSAYAVRLTPAGLRAYKVIEREMGEMEQRFARLLGKKNSMQLVDLLQKLRRGLLQEVTLSKRSPARSAK
jgi:DNA-binding MarR family transcriptional regulator